MCVGIELPDSSLNTFTYDANLVRRSAEDSGGLAKFINDGQNVLQETNSGGTTQVAYTLEPQMYGNLISQRRSGATNWHLFDGLGSTERLTDSDEDPVATYLHKAFGLTSVLSGSSSNRYTWIGRLGYCWEPDGGEYDVRRRRYGPLAGVWKTQDSLMDDTNKYRYCRNSPGNLTDPSGLLVMCSEVIAGLAILPFAKHLPKDVVCKATKAVYGSLADTIDILGFNETAKAFRRWIDKDKAGDNIHVPWDWLMGHWRIKMIRDQLLRLGESKVKNWLEYVDCNSKRGRIWFESFEVAVIDSKKELLDPRKLHYFTVFGPILDTFGVILLFLPKGDHFKIQYFWRAIDKFDFHFNHGWFPGMHFICNPIPPPNWLPTLSVLNDSWAAEVENRGCAFPFDVVSWDYMEERVPCINGCVSKQVN